MEGDPIRGSARRNMDGAIAISLALTSYVSDSLPLLRNISCTRGPEPRDPLDRLILGWERNDRPWLEASLGPRARVSLNSWLDHQPWADMRQQLWPVQSAGVAVGYRFEIAGRWSEPIWTLPEPSANGVQAPDFDIETHFTDRFGNNCGRKRIRFLSVTENRVDRYLVDDSDLTDLLRLIGTCATRTANNP
jgi:hypothetical protein